MRTISTIVLAILFCSLAWAQTSTVNYTASTEDIPNPERGFYLPSATYASNYTFLDSANLASKRQYFTPFNADYMVHTTLIYRYFVLDDFINSAISTTFLNNLQSDFNVARQAGVKLIIRFTYTNTPPSGNCGSWICPPYGDASKSQVLAHIAQLKPYLIANKDIIATMQMGFIGVWGENYYTDYFGDPSQSPFILTDTNWTDRNEVLDSLLRALPSDRMIQVRYPQMKQRFVYGLGSPTNSAPLTIAEAFNGSDKARIGLHNDCFLASFTDFGTYNDYGPPVSMADTINLKPYLETDSQFVPIGGETCFVNEPNDDCESNNGNADKELNRFNFSFLNCEYNNDVNNDWEGVCMDEIKRNMGYRFELIDGTYPIQAIAGSKITISINLENVGYTSLYNPRGIEIILRNNANDDTYYAPLNIDPRFWSPGQHSINEDICLPFNLAPGNYELLLNLPDPEPTLFDNPNYSIQLANSGVWEASTGFNKLNHNITIIGHTANTYCFESPMFLGTSKFDPNYCPNMLSLADELVTQIYDADDSISTTATISQNKYSVLNAKSSIELNGGFEVELGAEFMTIFEGCLE